MAMVQLTSTCLLLPLLLCLLAGLECATTVLAHKGDAVVANEGGQVETVKELLHKTTKKAADGTRIKIGGAAEDVQEEEEGESEAIAEVRRHNVGKCRHGCQVIMSDVGLKSSFLSFSSDYHMAKRHPPKNN